MHPNKLLVWFIGDSIRILLRKQCYSCMYHLSDHVWSVPHLYGILAFKYLLKLCTKVCDEDVFKELVWYSYDELLRDSKLPTLKDRRLLLKLSYLFQVINGSFSFPNVPLTLCQTRSLRNWILASIWRDHSHEQMHICIHIFHMLFLYVTTYPCHFTIVHHYLLNKTLRIHLMS